jgi:hypothetical protein
MKARILASGLAILLLAGCGKSADEKKAEQVPPQKNEPAAPAAARAKQALKEAGNSASDAAAKLGEAGKAAAQALQQQAPAVRQKLGEAADTVQNAAENAGQRLENAGEALLADPDEPPLDEEDDGGDADAPAVPGSAGTADPDHTGSVGRASPPAPAQ